MSNQLATISPLDLAEAAMMQHPRIESPIRHCKFAGFYIRQISMPAGAVIASKVHKTEHPFSVTQGRCLVYNELGEQLEEIVAPYVGITKPGTRRLLKILEPTIWTTFHYVGGESDIEKIEEMLIHPHINPILQLPHAMLQDLPPGRIVFINQEVLP